MQSSNLSFKISDDLPGHLNSHFVRQMQFVSPGLRASPLIPAVSFHLPLRAVLELLGGGPSAPRVEPGHALHVVLGVEVVNPAVYLGQLH